VFSEKKDQRGPRLAKGYNRGAQGGGDGAGQRAASDQIGYRTEGEGAQRNSIIFIGLGKDKRKKHDSQRVLKVGADPTTFVLRGTIKTNLEKGMGNHGESGQFLWGVSVVLERDSGGDRRASSQWLLYLGQAYMWGVGVWKTNYKARRLRTTPFSRRIFGGRS